MGKRTDSRFKVANEPDTGTASSERQENEQILETAQNAETVVDSFETPTTESFDVQYEPPKKRGRPKGSTNRKRKSAAIQDNQLTDLVCALLDTVGDALSDEGALNDTERALLTISLNETVKHHGDTVEKYSAYLYPVTGLVALAMWGRRVATNLKHESPKARQEDIQNGYTTNPTISTTPTNGISSDDTHAIPTDPNFISGFTRRI